GAARRPVPENVGFEHARQLQERGYALSTKREPFFEERAVKTKEEVRAIEATQRAVELAVQRAIELLRSASVKDGLIVHEGRPVTSERIKTLINVALMEQGCVAQHTIIAGGIRSEEHTSELQSRVDLVCRLLLEK